MATQAHDIAATRERLLEAAGEVFAARGFAGATARAICQRARANVAAINYHFGDKETLYAEVLRQAHRCSVELDTLRHGPLPAGPAETQLLHFVQAFLGGLFAPGRPAWQVKLMAREMVEPTAALNALVKESIRPMFDLLQQIVAELLGPQADEIAVRFHAASVIAQCLFYRHSQPVIQRLYPEMTYSPEQVAFLTEHITRFSLGALKSERQRLQRAASNGRARR